MVSGEHRRLDGGRIDRNSGDLSEVARAGAGRELNGSVVQDRTGEVSGELRSGLPSKSDRAGATGTAKNTDGAVRRSEQGRRVGTGHQVRASEESGAFDLPKNATPAAIESSDILTKPPIADRYWRLLPGMPAFHRKSRG